MYRSQEDKLRLVRLVTKFKGNTPIPYTPVVHAKSDKSAAKKVLERLLAGATPNEILSIKEITQAVTSNA